MAADFFGFCSFSSQQSSYSSWDFISVQPLFLWWWKKGTGIWSGHKDQHLLIESLSSLELLLHLENHFLWNLLSLFHSFHFCFCTMLLEVAKPLSLPSFYMWGRCWMRGEGAKSHITHLASWGIWTCWATASWPQLQCGCPCTIHLGSETP